MKDLNADIARTIRKVFGLPASERLEAVAYKDHPRWDSLGHIQLVLALEKEFGVKFSSEEVVSIKTVADIAAVLSKKAPQKS